MAWLRPAPRLEESARDLYLTADVSPQAYAPRRAPAGEGWICSQRPCAPAASNDERSARLLFRDR